jgi:thiol:disulfide interchange protein DsbD
MRRWIAFVALAWSACFAAPQDPFSPTLAVAEAQSVELRFDVAPHHFLYRDRFEAHSPTPGVQLGPLDVPTGLRRPDPVGGESVELLAGRVAVRVPFLAGDGVVALEVGYQGCTDTGVCLAPRRRTADVTLQRGRVQSAAWRSASADAPAPPPQQRIERALASGNLALVGAIFLGAGLLLSLTPCSLPMVPILAALLLGGPAAAVGRGRSVALTVAYTLGMATSYTAAGVAAGLLGEGLSARLQGPVAVGGFSALLAALALSMLGVFELRVAAPLQDRVTARSNRLRGGRIAGVFAMGALSALLVGPCVAAPFAGALAFIGRTGDVVLGAVALFFLAIGLAAPLLAMGMSAGALRPHAWRWTRRLEPAFGWVLLAVAAWMAAPVLGARTTLALAAATLAVAAAAAWHRRAGGGGRTVAAASTALSALALAAAITLPADAPPWPPRLLPGTSGSAVAFVPVADAAALSAALAAADRPVVVFFSADWCLTCRQIERRTFPDPQVRHRLAALLRLRVDVGAGTPAQRALLRGHGLYGPPAILVFRPGPGATEAGRIVGDATPAELLALLERAGV